MKNPLLKLIDVSKYYSTKDAVTLGLRKVSTEFQKGDFVAITGESGSGKSTLLNVLSGIDSYEDGEMYLNGDETSCYTTQEWDDYRRENIAFIFQDYSLIDSYTVLQNVELSLYDKYPKRADRKKRALELLEKVDLLSHRRHKCTKLSGGQKQRVAIARALAKDAPIILADEPTGNLDSTTSQAIIQLMAETSKDKLLIMVTHSFDDVEGFANRRIRMHDGSIVEDKIVLTIEKEDTAQKLDELPKQDTPTPLIEEKVAKKQFSVMSRNYIKKLKRSYTIAINNLLATPKRSIFILTTSFLATLMLAFFLFSYINIIYPPAGQNMMGDRKDTLFVVSKERTKLDEDEFAKIKGVNGINAVLTDYDVYRKVVYPKNMNWEGISGVYEIPMTLLVTANFHKKKPAYGTLPQNENEIMLGWADKGKPDLTLIGKEIEIVLMDDVNQGYYYDDMLVEYMPNSFLVAKFVLTGFDSGQGCYVTPKGLKTLSEKYINNESAYYDFEMDEYLDGFGDLVSYSYYEVFGNKLVINDPTIAPNIFYYVYNPNEKLNGTRIWRHSELSTLGEFFTVYGGREVYGVISKNADELRTKVTILPATPSINPEIYNAHIREDFEPRLVTKNLADYSTPKVNDTTALVIIGADQNANKIINSLDQKGFKVIYPFSKPLDPESMLSKIAIQVMSILAGIAIMLIAVSLISEVYNRVSKSKKKDFNIFRTVGLSNNIIKSINYAEFFIINIIAFVGTFLTFAIIAIIGNASNKPKIINAINSLLPFGAFHIQSLVVYACVFALLMLLTLLIAKKVYKKMFKTRVKKSLSDNN